MGSSLVESVPVLAPIRGPDPERPGWSFYQGSLVADTGRFDAVVEAGVVGEEVEADSASGAVAVFGDVDDG